MNWPLKRDSSISPSSEHIEELWVVCGLYRKMELRYWLVHKIINWLNEKRLSIP